MKITNRELELSQTVVALQKQVNDLEKWRSIWHRTACSQTEYISRLESALLDCSFVIDSQKTVVTKLTDRLSTNAETA